MTLAESTTHLAATPITPALQEVAALAEISKYVLHELEAPWDEVTWKVLLHIASLAVKGLSLHSES